MIELSSNSPVLCGILTVILKIFYAQKEIASSRVLALSYVARKPDYFWKFILKTYCEKKLSKISSL